jgi:hypothetical protein
MNDIVAIVVAIAALAGAWGLLRDSLSKADTGSQD